MKYRYFFSIYRNRLVFQEVNADIYHAISLFNNSGYYFIKNNSKHFVAINKLRTLVSYQFYLEFYSKNTNIDYCTFYVVIACKSCTGSVLRRRELFFYQDLLSSTPLNFLTNLIFFISSFRLEKIIHSHHLFGFCNC